MIDTLKLKIPVDEKVVEAFKERACNSYLSNTEYKNTKRYITPLTIFPYNREIIFNLVEWEEGYSLTTEFSVPKLYYGHNLYLFYPDELNEVLFQIEVTFNQFFKVSMPSFPEWQIKRLDLCYVWQLASRELALALMLGFAPFNYPRKNESIYPTGFLWHGVVETVRLYLKYDEFLKKDFKQINKHDSQKAYELKNLCRGSLRFEVQLRTEKINSLFKKDIVNSLDLEASSVLQKILKQELSILVKGFKPQIMTKQQIIDLIKRTFPAATALHLTLFYLSYMNHRDKTLLNNNFNTSTINRYLKQIKEAGAGLLAATPELIGYEMDIPSIHVINQTNILNPIIIPTPVVPVVSFAQPPLLKGFRLPDAFG